MMDDLARNNPTFNRLAEENELGEILEDIRRIKRVPGIMVVIPAAKLSDEFLEGLQW